MGANDQLVIGCPFCPCTSSRRVGPRDGWLGPLGGTVAPVCGAASQRIALLLPSNLWNKKLIILQPTLLRQTSSFAAPRTPQRPSRPGSTCWRHRCPGDHWSLDWWGPLRSSSCWRDITRTIIPRIVCSTYSPPPRPVDEEIELTNPAVQEPSSIDSHPMPLRPSISFRNRFPKRSGKVGRMTRKTRRTKRPGYPMNGA
jgi:hypothetical protein